MHNIVDNDENLAITIINFFFKTDKLKIISARNLYHVKMNEFTVPINTSSLIVVAVDTATTVKWC